MSGAAADICILTFAVDRPRELARCIAGVAAQVGAPRLRHRVLSERAEALRGDPYLAAWHDLVEWQALDGAPFQGASSPRLARLRDAALREVEELLVCFLDDDNAIEPDHFASLLELIEGRQLDAAHSWRLVLNPDGSLFSFSHYPWHDDVEIADKMYRWCVDYGTIIPGDPVMRDGVRGPAAETNYATVDMNEWLFRTERLRRIGFDAEFSSADLHNRTGEDDKLYRRFLAHAVRFGCTERPTLRYYLGGVSNLALTSGPTVDA